MRLFSPAKINLFLQILGQRADGYHELRTLMCCVGLFDTISIDFEGAEISASCSHPLVPQDQRNLACRAAHAFLAKIQRKTGVRIAIEKQIPVGAGLGGGSSNAAAVLLGLNRHFGEPLSRAALRELGLKIGADVPFFVDRKPALASGVGEILKPYIGLKPTPVLLIYPGFSISTAEMFRIINLRLTNCAKKIKVFTFKDREFDIRRHLHNDFEKVAQEKFPEIGAVKQALLKQGALGALMSGSGSAVYGLFRDRNTAAKACSDLRRHEKWQLFLTDLLL